MHEFLGLESPTLIAAIALAVGFPLLLLVLNELINACQRRRISITPTLRSLRNLVLPSLALAIFVRQVMELPREETWVRLVESAFWVCLLIAVLTFLNDVIFGAAEKGSWRERVPTLFRDLARVLLVGLGAAVIYSQVWDQEITGALTALGIGSVVLGLALQEPLGNIVSGLMLLFERPLNIGDWITADGVTGKVIEITGAASTSRRPRANSASSRMCPCTRTPSATCLGQPPCAPRPTRSASPTITRQTG